MKDTKDFPHIPKDLLTALTEIYPDKLPKLPTVSLNEVNFLQGQQSVIEFLRTIHERQNKNILESK